MLRWRNGHEDHAPSTPTRVVVPGIQNLGNTCFFNAILQALAATDSFSAYLTHVLDLAHQRGRSLTFAEALAGCIKNLGPVGVNEKCPSVVPKDLNRELCTRLASFRGNKQQDSQELLQFLINMVNDEQQSCTRRDGGLSDIFAMLGLVGSTGMDSSTSSSLSEGVPFGGSISDLCFEEGVEERRWNPLYGLQVDLMLCSGCRRYRPMTNRRFLDVSLSFGEDAITSRKPITLFDCLRRYTAPEVISGVECSYCTAEGELEQLRRDCRDLQSQLDANPGDLDVEMELLELRDTTDSIQAMLDTEDEKLFRLDVAGERCRALRDYQKRLQFSRCPDVFCFHFNRKVFHAYSGSMRKLDTHVGFPIELDMSPFCRFQQPSHQGAGTNGSATNGNGHSHGHSNQKPQEGHQRASNSAQDREFLIYELVAVILHHGNDRYGHFTAYRRVRETQQWFFISDNTVRDATEAEVLSCCAYMLFYERKHRDDASVGNGFAKHLHNGVNGYANGVHGKSSSTSAEDEDEDDEAALARVPDEEPSYR